MKNSIATLSQVSFYEGSYQFKTVTTDKNITSDFIEMVLAKQ